VEGLGGCLPEMGRNWCRYCKLGLHRGRQEGVVFCKRWRLFEPGWIFLEVPADALGFRSRAWTYQLMLSVRHSETG